jgi:periplasmic divalent cation tolerance protein
METTVWVVQTTLPGDWSEAMVGEWCFELVDEGLMACAHHSKIRSTYRWEDTIQSDPEWRIQCKTSETSKQSLIDEIHSKHPYDLPMVIWFKAETSSDFAEWVNEK